MMEDNDAEGDFGDGDLFVQEEYDLAANLDQMITRMDTFDEYKHFTDLAKLCH